MKKFKLLFLVLLLSLLAGCTEENRNGESVYSVASEEEGNNGFNFEEEENEEENEQLPPENFNTYPELFSMASLGLVLEDEMTVQTMLDNQPCNSGDRVQLHFNGTQVMPNQALFLGAGENIANSDYQLYRTASNDENLIIVKEYNGLGSGYDVILFGCTDEFGLTERLVSGVFNSFDTHYGWRISGEFEIVTLNEDTNIIEQANFVYAAPNGGGFNGPNIIALP